MMTKNDIVLGAFEELRISGITVIPNGNDTMSAIKRLDSMVLGWQNKGLCLGYVRTDATNGIEPSQNSGIGDTDEHAVILNLAKSLAPMYGKSLHPDTRMDAKSAYLGLFSTKLTMRESNPCLPLGSGNSFGYGHTDRVRYQEKEDHAPIDCSTFEIKVGETGVYTYDFNRYLAEVEGDEISSYTVDDGEGVSILSHSEGEGVITLTASGLTEGYAPIIVTITTSSDRVNPETINFNVSEP